MTYHLDTLREETTMLDQDETRQRRRWQRARATLVAACIAALLNAGLWLWLDIPPDLWRAMIVTVALFSAWALAVAALEVRGLL